MGHHINIPSTHRPCPNDIAELRKLREWWTSRPKMAASIRGQSRIAHLTRQIEEMEKELQTHEKHIAK